MAQPQNPSLNPLLARIEGNPTGADLIQIVEAGSQVIYRINNFQAVWYVGSGNPTFIPGQLLTNLYLDNTTGNIWELEITGWVQLPGAGQGGGVSSLNGLFGVLSILAGAGISVTPAGSGITVANTGILNVTAGTGIGVSITNGVAQVTNTDINLGLPWTDIQTYGGVPKPYANKNDSTTATTISGSANVTVGSALTYFQNGAGVCIWQAGNTTSQGTPNPPTITSPAVSGTQILTYASVGFDASGGLTAASVSGTVATAPAVFGPKPVVISSITASGGTVTANFSSPLNNSVTVGMTIHIVGVTGSGATWNGIYTIASAPTTSQVTYAVSGATGTGTVGAASTGRVSNSAIVTAISRNSSGVISLTTAQNHNWAAQPIAHTPTIVVIEGCSPADLNGFYPLATASGTSATIQTGNLNAETGVVTAGTSIATVWEFTTVSCGALSGTTVGYYIYSDSASPGGSLNLIGKTLWGESHFTDWGPFYSSGYVAPAYVPTTAPARAQNQMFTSTILSGGGTTSLVLANNVPTSMPALSATILYDDGPCLKAAATAAASKGGFVFLSPPNVSETNPVYVFNSTVVYPAHTSLQIGTGMYVNETIQGFTDCLITAPYGAALSISPPFSQRGYAEIFGLGNPMFLFNGSLGTNIDGVCFNNILSNGQYLLELFGASYCNVSNCAFDVNQFGTSVPLVFNGSNTSCRINNCTFIGNSIMGQVPVTGQGVFGPPQVPLIWFHASDNPAQVGYPSTQILFAGINNSYGRGIFVDGTYFTNATSQNWTFGSLLWDQAPTQPLISFSGPAYNGINIVGGIQDSISPPVLGNYCPQLASVYLDNCSTAGAAIPAITGLPIVGLTAKGIGDGINSNQTNQNYNSVTQLYGTANIASVSSPGFTASTLQAQPMEIGNTGVVFCPFTPPVVTASASGVGTWASGNHVVQVTMEGWDGGEGGTQGAAVIVVTNGSQGILVSWTAVTGVQGINVNIDGHRQNASPLTGTSHTFTGVNSIAASAEIDASGLPLVNSAGVFTESLIIPSGLNKLTISGPTLTANRAVTFADAPQSTVVAASLTTTSGGSPYTVTLQGMLSSSHISITPTNAAAALDCAAGNVWVGTKSANQVVINTGTTAGETFDIIATVV
jgi:hypothetical protein